jgi:hypothetical protein
MVESVCMLHFCVNSLESHACEAYPVYQFDELVRGHATQQQLGCYFPNCCGEEEADVRVKRVPPHPWPVSAKDRLVEHTWAYSLQNIRNCARIAFNTRHEENLTPI